MAVEVPMPGMTRPGSAASALRLGSAQAPRARLFCLPFAGGGSATFRTWPAGLPDDVEVQAIRLPGREPPGRGTPPDTIGALMEAVRPVIEDASDLPFALFGHSMGALLAFELTVAMEADGGPSPTHLFVSARRSPYDTDQTAPINALPDEPFLDALQLRYGGVPDVVRSEPDLMALLLPALRADVRAFESYAPLTDRKVQCPVIVFGGLEDPRPAPAELTRWQHVAQQPVQVRLFSGDHFYLVTEREALTAAIGAVLAAGSDDPST